MRKGLLTTTIITALMGAPAAAQAVTAKGTTVGVFTQGIGYSSWKNLGGALEEIGSTYERFAETEGGREEAKFKPYEITKGLTVTGFNLNLPSTAIYDTRNIHVRFSVRNSHGGTSPGEPFSTYSIVSLVKAGKPMVAQSYNALIGYFISPEETPAGPWCAGGPYGWCPKITGAELDDPNFGVMIQAESLTGPPQLEIYGVQNVTLEVS